ncbi:3-hydroxyacyl-CoA dehydrogenase type-2-like [Convolutriloba macropyga]|uniref:3-hydroxyacyl-CoA dehydrogenase type-2-like n=1 Tax=Convolutriloba macropyga TaxID=536237 RepID=UPI003F51B00B
MDGVKAMNGVTPNNKHSKGDHYQNGIGNYSSSLEASLSTSSTYANGTSHHNHHNSNGRSQVSSNAEHENSMSMSMSNSFDLESLEISHDGSNSPTTTLNRVDSSTVVFITGGGSGLGAATARRFARFGAKISIFDIKPSAEKIVFELGPDRSLFTQGDVNIDDDLAEAMDLTIAKFGKITLNVNCAGIGSHSLLYDAKKDKMHSEKSFHNVIKTNLIGTFNSMRHCSRVMAKNGGNAQDGRGGLIINTGSISGSDGQMGQLAYSASKGGLESMTLPAARDLAPMGIRVVAISPGFFDTPLLRQAPEQAVSHIAKTLPLCPKRLGQPDEYAHLVQSIYENPMINGSVIRLDSGSRLPASMF